MMNTAVMGGGEPYLLSAEEAAALDADCVMVLGARVYEEGVLSSVLKDRVSVGIELYFAGAGKKLLMTGDHGQIHYDEVNGMKAAALEAGVPEDDLFLDHAGFSTYESMVRAKEVFGVKKMVVVTQSFHLPRAVWLARQMGIEAYGVSSDLRPYKNQWYNDAREFGARAKDWLYALLRPAPRYLGDPIDITGSGTVTFD